MDVKCNHQHCQNNISGYCNKPFIHISYIGSKPICVSYRVDNLKNAPDNFEKQELKPSCPKEYIEYTDKVFKECEE